MDRLSRNHQKFWNDRLSALPDAVVCHILRLLPTKVSVSTSILARRWRFMWAHVPNIDFTCKNSDTETNIPDIICRVMLRQKVKKVDTFRLSRVVCTEFQLETWICTAIERSVRNIDLLLTVMVPRCLFTCKTLVDLKLHSCKGIPSNGAIYLPSLKRLHLHNVKNLLGEALSHLISGCPVLEDLFIFGHMTFDMGCYNISSPTIKSLTVMRDIFDFVDYDYGVEINSPAIEYLKLHDCLFGRFSAQTLTSLVEAEICCNCLAKVFDIVDQLCNVKYLTISCDAWVGYSNLHHHIPCFLTMLDLWILIYKPNIALGSLIVCEYAIIGILSIQSMILRLICLQTSKDVPIREFDNLTKLEIDTDWLILKLLLESAHHLEDLIIRQAYNHCNWIDPKQVPKCLLTHLKTVTIREFQCSKKEFVMVEYLLGNAKVLKSMEIYSRHGAEKFKALQRLSLFPRGSDACKLAFY